MKVRCKICTVCLFLSFISIFSCDNIETTLESEFKEKYGNQNFISIQVQRSNVLLDWASPTEFLLSLAGSAINAGTNNYKHVFGHVTLVYGKNGEIHGYGQTGDHEGMDFYLLRRGFGFTSIKDFIFTDGSLQRDEEIHEINIDASLEDENSFSWITFLVTEENIENLENYIKRYEAAKAYINYGNPVDAKKLEGGVCTTFVNACLYYAGIDFSAIDEWYRELLIPEDLLGYNKSAEDSLQFVKYNGNPRDHKIVNIYHLTHSYNWGEPGESFILFDPELFYDACAILENQWGFDNGYDEIKPIFDEGLPGYSRLKNVLLEYYDSKSDKMSPGILYQTYGLVVDLK